MPPTGRAINAPANTPYDLINSAVWELDGKNAVPMGWAKNPNTIQYLCRVFLMMGCIIFEIVIYYNTCKIIPF